MEDFNIEELIGQIIDVENTAQNIMSKARRTGEELSARVEADFLKKKADIESQMREESDRAKKTVRDEAEKKLREIEEKTEKQMSALKEKYGENKKQWIDNIVSSIIRS